MTPLPATLTPETELLLLAVRQRLQPDAALAARLADLAASTATSPELLALARWHGLLPLLYRALAAVGAPAAVTSRYRAAYLANAAQMTRLLHELHRLQALFTTARLRVVPFKGPVLAAQLYGDFTMRQSVDLDLLTTRADLPGVIATLQAQGYRPTLTLDEHQSAAYRRSGQDWVLWHPQRRLFIDVNTVIASHTVARPEQVEAMLDRTVTQVLPEGPVLGLRPEDTLIALGMHGGRHAWDQLGQIADLAALLTAGAPLAWELIVAELARWRVRRTVLTALTLAARLFPVALPPDMAQLARADPQVDRQAAAVAARLCAAPLGPRSQLATWWFCLRSRDEWRDRLRFALRELCVPSTLDWQTLPLPGRCAFLYAVLRPLRLLAELLRHPLKGAGRRTFKPARTNSAGS